jgi:AmmeMemoRadiSam system protein A
MSSPPEQLNSEEQRALLEWARAAIVSSVAGGPLRPPQPEPACFGLQRGVFVTVHVAGKLRGCIGVIEPSESLRNTVRHCAESAALRDGRFAPVNELELHDLVIEISVLSELAPLEPEKVEIGKHGLYVANQQHHGLLLPQVALEHRLSREQFLEETCRKAGLPRDAWRRKDMMLYGFTCQVFQEA